MYCFLCGASLSDPAADSGHLQGAKHMKRINWPLSYWTPPEKDEWDQVISCSEGDAGAHGSQIQDQNLDEVRDAWGAMVDAATAAAPTAAPTAAPPAVPTAAPTDGDMMRSLSMTHDIAEVKASIDEGKASIVEVKASIAEVKASIDEGKASIVEVKASIAEVKASFADMKASIEQIKVMLAALSNSSVMILPEA
jgi:hypothetical protein